MKKATILCVCLLLSGVVLTRAQGDAAQSNDGLDAFWQKFRIAIMSGDKETVVGLSRFPIRMPGRVRNIKDGADLRLRYREVFNKYLNAAKCFDEKYYDDPRSPTRKYKYIEPMRNPDQPKLAQFNCGDNTVYLVEYHFELTAMGWKFVRLNRFNNVGRLFGPEFSPRVDGLKTPVTNPVGSPLISTSLQ